MSQSEHPERLHREVTVDDVRQLMGASTPHFALQLRNRIARLVDGLPAEHPARRLGEQEIDRLNRLGITGEVRGHPPEDGMRPLASNALGLEHGNVGGPGAEAPEPHTTPHD